jgi:hypothetical protein
LEQRAVAVVQQPAGPRLHQRAGALQVAPEDDIVAAVEDQRAIGGGIGLQGANGASVAHGQRGAGVHLHAHVVRERAVGSKRSGDLHALGIVECDLLQGLHGACDGQPLGIGDRDVAGSQIAEVGNGIARARQRQVSADRAGKGVRGDGAAGLEYRKRR